MCVCVCVSTWKRWNRETTRKSLSLEIVALELIKKSYVFPQTEISFVAPACTVSECALCLQGNNIFIGVMNIIAKLN